MNIIFQSLENKARGVTAISCSRIKTSFLWLTMSFNTDFCQEYVRYDFLNLVLGHGS